MTGTINVIASEALSLACLTREASLPGVGQSINDVVQGLQDLIWRLLRRSVPRVHRIRVNGISFPYLVVHYDRYLAMP